MPINTAAPRFIIELKPDVAARLAPLIDAQIEPQRAQIEHDAREYDVQLTAWKAAGIEFAKRANRGELGNSSDVRRLGAEHNARRPKRPVGRPRSKLKQVEINDARNAVITALILAVKGVPKTKRKSSTA